MAFPLAAGAFGSQPFGQAMEGLNKAKAPQPLNYEEWKADTGQAGASGYQNYTQGFTPNPALKQQGVQPPVNGSPSPGITAFRNEAATGGRGQVRDGNIDLFRNEAAAGGRGQVPPQPPPEQNYGMKAAQPGAPVQPPPNVDMEALIKMLMSSGLGQQVGNTQMFQNLLGRFRQ